MMLMIIIMMLMIIIMMLMIIIMMDNHYGYSIIVDYSKMVELFIEHHGSYARLNGPLLPGRDDRSNQPLPRRRLFRQGGFVVKLRMYRLV